MARPGTFPKGKSGNPGGRQKGVAEVQALAREYTKDAVNALVSICKGAKNPPAARVSAASALLDRGYGKPSQTTKLEGDVTLTLAALVEQSMKGEVDKTG